MSQEGEREPVCVSSVDRVSVGSDADGKITRKRDMYDERRRENKIMIVRVRLGMMVLEESWP